MLHATPKSLTVPELFALSQSHPCQGPYECHWCGGVCTDLWKHDDPGPILGVKAKLLARRPSNPYVCMGCWLWRRQSVTVRFLSGGLQDRRQAKDYGWLITRHDALVVRLPEDVVGLAKVLLRPPPQFALLLRVGNTPTLPQFGTVNERVETKGGDPLTFTLDNIPHQYSIYELELALKGEPEEGLEPGVRVLAGLIRPHLPPTVKEEPKKNNAQGGRPPAPPTAKQTTEKVVVRSGH